MKILELNFERGWRGGERQTLFNMIGFRNIGYEVSLLCRKDSLLSKKAKENNFSIICFKNFISVFIFLIKEGHNYNILHAQGSNILSICILTKPFHKTKIIFTRRVDFIPNGIFTKYKYRKANAIIAISSTIKKILQNFCHRDDIYTISSIIEKKELSKDKALFKINKLNISPNTFIIGTTSALVEHKDPMTMVDAIYELSLIRNDFVFLHFGQGILYNQISSRIKQLNIEKHYKLMGFHDNVEVFFSIFNVFVMCSIEEGLGSSVLDAFIYKVPVVSTTAGGLIDLISDNRAIPCKIKDFHDIKNRINNILNDPDEYKPMIDNAYKFAKEKHSMESITNRYKKLIESL